MASHPSRDELRSELRRQRLPQAYIERLLAELDDHYEDLLEERSTSMGAARKLQLEQDDLSVRLGEPAQLALFAAEKYHARSFWGRHPVVTFLVGPLPLLVAVWLATVFSLTGFGMGLSYVIEKWLKMPADQWDYPNHLVAQAIVMAIVAWIVVVVPPLSVAGLMCRTARRNAVSWRWPIVACGLVAALAATISVGYRIGLAQNEGFMNIGINYESTAKWVLMAYLPKFAVAMGIGLLLVKRAQRQLAVEA
jgi:hypothetical protein